MRIFLCAIPIYDETATDLVAFGMVCDDGAEFYAENGDRDFTRPGGHAHPDALRALRGEGLPLLEIARRARVLAEPAPEFWSSGRVQEGVLLRRLLGSTVRLRAVRDAPTSTLDALADARLLRLAWHRAQVMHPKRVA